MIPIRKPLDPKRFFPVVEHATPTAKMVEAAAPYGITFSRYVARYVTEFETWAARTPDLMFDMDLARDFRERFDVVWAEVLGAVEPAQRHTVICALSGLDWMSYCRLLLTAYKLSPRPQLGCR